MFSDLIRIGNYGANVFSSGIAIRPDDMRAMTQDEMAEYVRRQGDPRNVPMGERYAFGALANAVRWPAPRPTMTLAEYDARRKAFRP